MLVNPKKKYLKNLWDVLRYCKFIQDKKLGVVEIANPNDMFFARYDQVQFPEFSMKFIQKNASISELQINNQCFAVNSRVNKGDNSEEISFHRISISDKRRLSTYPDFQNVADYILWRRDDNNSILYCDGKLKSVNLQLVKNNSFNLFYLTLCKIFGLLMKYPEIKFSVANSKYFLRFNIFHPINNENNIKTSDRAIAINLGYEYAEAIMYNSSEKICSVDFYTTCARFEEEKFNKNFKAFEEKLYELNGEYFA